MLLFKNLINMKVTLFLCMIFLCFSCASIKKIEQKDSTSQGYLITEIKTINSWYIIYAEKQDTCYKIIVKKDKKENNDCKKIIIGNCYNLKLHAISENVPKIRGVKISPVNYLDMTCHAYDEETEICIEPENGIFDLYYTEDLSGLYYSPLCL